MACLRLFTFPPLPPLPDLSVPLFFRCIALFTAFPAPLLYFRPLLFFFGMIFPLQTDLFYDARRPGARSDDFSSFTEREFGALRLAPSSTPTPSRSTSSPPNHPAIIAITTAANDSANARLLGDAGSGRRKSQLPANKRTTSTFKPPCHSPTALARVLLGIPIQSISPKTAARRPPMIPAAIMYHAMLDHFPSDVLNVMISKMTAVASNPSGNTISMGCTGCPAIFIGPPKEIAEAEQLSMNRWLPDDSRWPQAQRARETMKYW